jgi:nitrate reductase NapE
MEEKQMASEDGEAAAVSRDTKSFRAEMLTFLVLAFGIWPIVAVGVVGGYGFLVWMWQIIFGPPGPPPGIGH